MQLSEKATGGINISDKAKKQNDYTIIRPNSDSFRSIKLLSPNVKPWNFLLCVKTALEQYVGNGHVKV